MSILEIGQELCRWSLIAKWTPRVQGALKPISDVAFNGEGTAVIDEVMDRLMARAVKVGLNV